MRNILGCFIIFIIMMTSQIFAGTAYYVDATNGSDTNLGTELMPWKTIQKATSTMVAGDTVIVKGGTYNERVTESTSGSPGNLITYQVKSGDTVTVYGFNLEGNYIKIDGFKCDPPAGNCTPPKSTGVYVTGDYCEVWNCYIYQAPRFGIRVWLNTSYCKIMNNYIYQCRSAGMDIYGDHHLVEGNEIEDIRCEMKGCSSNHAWGIAFFGTNHIFRGNYIHDITYDNNPGWEPHIDGWITWGGDEWHPIGTDCLFEKNVVVLPYSKTESAISNAFQLGGAINITIKNNIIKSHTGVHPYRGSKNITIVNNIIIGDLTLNASHHPVGIGVRDSSSNITIKNNIICEYSTHAIYIDNTTTGVDNDYNCIYNSDGSIPGGIHQPHDLWGINPKLVNLVGAKQSGGNEHLQSNSPCIDAGATLSEVNDDYDGNSRPYGAWYDIGAYEYVGENPLLEASCDASPTSGEVPLTVNFTGGATGGTPPYSYNWDFGDSTSSSEQNPTHTYNDAGDYTVNLIVTDSNSNQDSDSLTINASAVIAPLAASFIASPTSGEVPLTVNFTGGATGGTEPYTYSWDFGDSTSSSEQSPSHTYNDPDDYTVTLTVTDNDSNQDSDSLTINASAIIIIPLEASCTASPVLGEVPLTVNFNGSVTGGVLPYSYSWDFGDGTSSSEQNPIHTYSEAGDYTVTLILTDSQSNQDSDSLTINASVASIPPYLSCSPASLYFGSTTPGNESSDQYLRIINAGGGVLTWNIEDDATWLSCSPSSGTDRGEITVSVNTSGLPQGLYMATIIVSSPEAYNSPQYISVNLRVYESEEESSPFGSFDTRLNGSTVSGSVPITGWALDDIETTGVEIKRNSDPEDPPEAIGPDGLVYLGDAVFVEGARPNVENSYPEYPLNSRAGWGYMLLTNSLPNRGNGFFTIYAFAYDAGGHRVEIGRKIIFCDNTNSVKPFGTVDTPAQGESIGGSDYINFGWTLTPLPKTIPKDGSTILLWVDGVQVGEPVYNQYREDIAMLYPEYNNAQGAVGYYYLDTTQYENGVHTITWSVMDDGGEVDGIGARYFSIDNIETGNVNQERFELKRIYQEDVEGRLIIDMKEFRIGYKPQDDNNITLHLKRESRKGYRLQVEEMEPLRIVLEGSSGGNMNYIGWGESDWRALPIGSTFDPEKGIFSWIPTPGFIGKYKLYFAVTDGSYMSKPLQILVNVMPKSYN